ncbi:hypothetical protein V6N13_078764 [Hibiscus sabdariffa]
MNLKPTITVELWKCPHPLRLSRQSLNQSGNDAIRYRPWNQSTPVYLRLRNSSKFLAERCLYLVGFHCLA